MRYPVAIEPGSKTTAFGVVVPDLPGCFSAGDTLDDAMAGAEEAAAAWIDASLDAGEPIQAWMLCARTPTMRGGCSASSRLILPCSTTPLSA